MHELIQQLIDKHLGSNASVPAQFVNLLNELSDRLEQSYPNAPQSSPPQTDQSTIQAILNSLPFGVTLINKDKIILHANTTALNLMGYTSISELVGRVCHDSLCPAAEGECPIHDLKQQLDRSERVLITKTGERIPIIKSATPIIIEDEEVLLEAFIDISEQRRMSLEKDQEHQRRAWLAQNITEIIKAITAREQVHELYQQLVDQLASKFDYPRVQLLTYNPAANSLKVVTAAGRDGHVPQTQAAVVPIGRGTIGKAGETNTAIAADAPNIHYNDYPDLISPTIQSEYALPIATDQDLIGVLNIQSETPNQFDQDTKLFLETLTTQTALIIQTIKFKNEMRDQLDELSVLQRMASTEGWKTFDSTTTLSASRYIYDQNLQATIPVEDQKELSTNASLVKPLEIRGQTIGALGITTDQTQNLTREEKMLLESVSSEVAEALERARLFETSQRSAAELAVLNEMGNSFTQAQNEEAITDHIYTYTAKLMETPQFYVAFYNYDEEEITFPYVVMDGTRVTPEHPYYDQWLPKPVGTGLTGFIIKNQQPILIDDKVEETLEELGLPFRQFGGQTHSWLGVPMIIGNRVLGVISVQSEDTPNLYNQHHLNLLTTIASQAAVSINNTRLFQQEQERAEQERLVRTITDKVRRGTDTASILQVALQELSTILNADVSTIQLGTKDQLLSKQQSPENNQTTNLNGEQ